MTSEIQIQFLGTGTILPDPKRSCSSLLIRTAKEKMLVDAGPGTLNRLKEVNVKPQELTYIFVTHFHPDHISDLVSILFAIRNTHQEQNQHLLRVWGPRGFINFLHGMEIAYGKWMHSTNEQFKFYELKRRLLDFPGFRLIWGKVIHKNESVGYRLEIDGKVIMISGDSGYSSELIRLAKEADIAIIECSYPDELAVEGHLCPSLAAKIAKEANVRKLVLTHFYPGTSEGNVLEIAQKYYDGPIELAEDLMEYTLS
ncbi:MAG: MBL fold metallo-hydrolase [Calditrichia bacterium]